MRLQRIRSVAADMTAMTAMVLEKGQATGYNGSRGLWIDDGVVVPRHQVFVHRGNYSCGSMKIMRREAFMIVFCHSCYFLRIPL